MSNELMNQTRWFPKKEHYDSTGSLDSYYLPTDKY